MKNVISFALWGTEPMYVYGIFQNIKLAQRFYPDWICRFYVASDCPKEIKERIISMGAEVSVVSKTWEKVKYFWRLKIINCMDVDIFMIRDIDSRIGLREAHAVKTWLESEKAVHIMRDHPRHSVNIMGGMWAAHREEFIKLTGFKSRFKKYVDKVKDGWSPSVRMAKKGSCQHFLDKQIYPEIKDDVLVHTSQKKRAETDVPFPFGCPPRDINFVGQIYNEKNQPQCALK